VTCRRSRHSSAYNAVPSSVVILALFAFRVICFRRFQDRGIYDLQQLVVLVKNCIVAAIMAFSVSDLSPNPIHHYQESPRNARTARIGSRKLTARIFTPLSARRDCAIRRLSETRSPSHSPADQSLLVPGNPSPVTDASGIGGSIQNTNPGFDADALR